VGKLLVNKVDAKMPTEVVLSSSLVGLFPSTQSEEKFNIVEPLCGSPSNTATDQGSYSSASDSLGSRQQAMASSSMIRPVGVNINLVGTDDTMGHTGLHSVQSSTKLSSGRNSQRSSVMGPVLTHHEP
jgi:hypothetical protein